MIRINLLPIRQIKKIAKSRNEVFALGAGFLVLLLLIGAVAYSQTHKIEALNGEIAELKQEKAKYDKVIQQIAKIEKEKKLLETKLQVIKDLKSSSQIPVRVFDEIARLTPSTRLWLQSMSLKGSTINLAGTALDNETIAQYMVSIEKSPYFARAELNNSSLKVVQGQQLKSFGLTIAVKQLASKLEQAPKKGK
jgi:type IV pilus assembly protein PilN